MVGIGIIGCGNIAEKAYIPGCEHYNNITVIGCGDVDVERAKDFAQRHGLSFGGSVEDLLARDDVSCVLNLTTPQWHAAVNMQILQAGKHVYLEKPFALNRAEGKPVLDYAQRSGLRISCAPDTVLGPGIQHCRAVMDNGLLGKVHAVTLCMAGRGHESWHPDPEFYYAQGGGPLFDMGPYYLSALITLCGPVKRVMALSGQAFSQRTITSEPKNGSLIDVEVPTHVTALLETHSGVMVTLIMSFDVAGHHVPKIEVHGTLASLSVPDPNQFDGPIQFIARTDKEWSELSHERAPERRGVGVAEMVQAIDEERPHRANGEMAFHVLDIMQSIHEASAQGTIITLTTTCSQPASFPGMATH